MRVKLVKETLNEIWESSKKSDNYHVDKFLDDYEQTPDNANVSDLAQYIDDNWNDITGLTNRDKDEEQDFPSEVQEILNELNVDYNDFSDAWGSVREGSDDWEPRQCENCGEDIEDYRDWEGEDLCQACADEAEENEDDDY